MTFAARDNHGQDPQGECEARKRQVQDFEGSQERQHQEKSGSIWKYVNSPSRFYLNT